VGEGLLVQGRAAHPGGGEDVVPVRQADPGELRGGVGVEGAPFLEQDADAADVGDEQVEAEVQARQVAGQVDGGDAEQRPGVGGAHLVGDAGAQLVEAAGALLVRHLAQVDPVEGVRAGVGQDALAAVVGEDGVEHGVAGHQPDPGALQGVQVDAGVLDLPVDVGGDVAEGEVAEAADPLGLLDLGQRERLVQRVRVGDGDGQRLHGLLVAGAAVLCDEFGDGGDGGGAHQVAHGDGDAEVLADAGHDLGGEQGVPAEFDEAVVHTDRGDAEEVLPDGGDGRLARAARLLVGGGQGGPGVVHDGLGVGVVLHEGVE
jgi:hypothetical protein